MKEIETKEIAELPNLADSKERLNNLKTSAKNCDENNSSVKDKVENLVEKIIAECKLQEFTVAEVESLQTALYLAVEDRRQATNKELF